MFATNFYCWKITQDIEESRTALRYATLRCLCVLCWILAVTEGGNVDDNNMVLLAREDDGP